MRKFRRNTFLIDWESGVGQLDIPVTFGSETETPAGRWKMGDAVAGSVPAWTHGETLTIGGNAPTLNTGSPGLGTEDDSCTFGGDGRYAASGNAFCQVGANDFRVEALVRMPDVAEAKTLLGKDAGGVRWELQTTAGPAIAAQVDDGSTDTTVTSAALQNSTWYHVTWTYDTSGNQVLQVNGVASGAADDVSAVGDLDVAGAFTIGDRTGGGNSSNAAIAFVAVYIGDATWVVPAEMAALELERFQRLSGHWPLIAKGTAAPNVYTRATAAYVEKWEGGTARMMHQVGPGWLRCSQWKDANGVFVTGAQVEPVGVNLVDWSETFDIWPAPNSSTVANQLAAPDRRLVADLFSEDGTAADKHQMYNTTTFPTLNAQYVFSVFLKPTGNRDWVFLECQNIYRNYFDIANGTVGTAASTVTTSDMIPYGNGWYRCWICRTMSDGNLPVTIGAAEADGDNVFDGLNQTDFYVFGAMLEEVVAGGFTYPSSYIPVLDGSAGVTRNQDLLRYVANDGNIDHGVGSARRGRAELDFLISNYSDEPQAYIKSMMAISDGGSLNDVLRFEVDDYNADNDLTVRSSSSGDPAGANRIETDISDGVLHNIKTTWKQDELLTVLDRSSAAIDTDCIPPDELDRIDIGTGVALAKDNTALISRLRISRR